MKLVRRRFPAISATDPATIANFSNGNARVAMAPAWTLRGNETISGLNNDQLLPHLIEQRDAHDPALMLAAEACSLVYAFDGEDIGDDSEFARLRASVGQNANEVFRHLAALLAQKWLSPNGTPGEILNLDQVHRAAFENIAPILPTATLGAIERPLGAVEDAEVLQPRSDDALLLRKLALRPGCFPAAWHWLGNRGRDWNWEGRNRTSEAFSSLFRVSSPWIFGLPNPGSPSVGSQVVDCKPGWVFIYEQVSRIYYHYQSLFSSAVVGSSSLAIWNPVFALGTPA